MALSIDSMVPVLFVIKYSLGIGLCAFVCLFSCYMLSLKLNAYLSYM